MSCQDKLVIIATLFAPVKRKFCTVNMTCPRPAASPLIDAPE